MPKITELTVTYEDGSTQSWKGRGSLRFERTGTTSSNQLNDNDTRYVAASLQYEDDKEA